MNQYLRVFLLGVCCVSLARCYGRGAPQEACNNLIPKGHTGVGEIIKAQQGPYDMDMPPKAAPGQQVPIVISGAAPFKGFIVRVLHSETGMGAGAFLDSPRGDYRTMMCSRIDDTATHESPNPKNSVTLIWRAPSEPGVYLVMGTIVHSMEYNFVGYKGMITVDAQRRFK